MKRKNPIQNAALPIKEAYVSYDPSNGETFAIANKTVGEAIDSIRAIQRSSASVNVRQDMTREDYDYFRPGEAAPVKDKEILDFSFKAYKRNGIFNNIINLMTDFTVDGIKVVHPNRNINRLFQAWFKSVRGKMVSQEFVNTLFLTGRVIPKKTMGYIPQRIQDVLKQGQTLSLAGEDDIRVAAPKRAPRNTIPVQYEFLNPKFVELMGGDLAAFAGIKKYGLQVPQKLIGKIRHPISKEDKDIINSLPAYIVNPIRLGSDFIELDPERISVFHYKKHSWETWAQPIITPVIDDLIIIQKLKLGDIAALDGAISKIRVWKLGDLQLGIMPTPAAIEKLQEILSFAGNGQTLDVLWGPDINLIETKSDTSAYLGQEKYIPHLTAFYAGLGIPPALTGLGGQGNYTNNFLSLKTLIERLNFARDLLIEFWENELQIIQEALQLRFPAQLEFKNMVLSDENAYNQLLINLLDRDVISLERIRDHFGFVSEIEDSVIKSEYRSRDSKKLPSKASPFHAAQPEFALKKIFAQTGAVAPSEVGLELQPKKAGEVRAIDVKVKRTGKEPASNLKGQPGQGRPKNSKDTSPRKTKVVKPSVNASFINLQLWAKDAQASIADILHPIYLKKCNKKNMRSLTTAEVEDIEHLKFSILCNLEPFVDINQDALASLLKEPLTIPRDAENFWKGLVAAFVAERQVNPTIEDIRQMQNYIYAMLKGEGGDNGED